MKSTIIPGLSFRNTPNLYLETLFKLFEIVVFRKEKIDTLRWDTDGGSWGVESIVSIEDFKKTFDFSRLYGTMEVRGTHEGRDEDTFSEPFYSVMPCSIIVVSCPWKDELMSTFSGLEVIDPIAQTKTQESKKVPEVSSRRINASNTIESEGLF